jgi:hypothetical protein
MRFFLTHHPDTPCDAVAAISVDIDRPSPDTLRLHYLLEGDLDWLKIPLPSPPPERADRLWEHSCFEAFVRVREEIGYCELNFSPSGAWAAYRFESYRARLSHVDLAPAEIASEVAGRTVMLTAIVRPDLDPDLVWEVGLATIVEDVTGERSFFALVHPPGEPDFHHRDCFVVDLPPAGRG